MVQKSWSLTLDPPFHQFYTTIFSLYILGIFISLEILVIFFIFNFLFLSKNRGSSVNDHSEYVNVFCFVKKVQLQLHQWISITSASIWTIISPVLLTALSLDPLFLERKSKIKKILWISRENSNYKGNSSKKWWNGGSIFNVISR